MSQRIAIVINATNKYYLLGMRLIENFNKYYKGHKEVFYFVFTDKKPNVVVPNVFYEHCEHRNWKEGTNTKFKNILSLKDKLQSINIRYVFYMDADTNVDKNFSDDIFIGNSVGAEHFFYNSSQEEVKPYERNENSSAYIPVYTPLKEVYYQGAFFGGSTENIIRMCTKLIEMQTMDQKIGIEPIWNDESYLNKYFHINPPTKIILFKNFPFIVSDKGGLEDQRHFVKENYGNRTFQRLIGIR